MRRGTSPRPTRSSMRRGGPALLDGLLALRTHRLDARPADRRLTLVDPGLDADDAVRGVGLGEAVVDVGAQRVQRQAPLEVPLGARDLGAAEPARAAQLDAARAQAHGGL